MNAVLWLLLGLQTKHLLADWLLQPKYMHQNKGVWFHPGGLLHAGFHGFLTFFLLLVFTDPSTALVVSISEGIIHYLIDYAKMNITRIAGWVPLPKGNYSWPKSEVFWMFLGVDQYLHQLCYIFIIWFVLFYL